jgi:hypothetical protein
MITRAKKPTTPTTHDAISIGSAIKQNIVEKLPAINTQVNNSEVVYQKTKEILFLDRFTY